MTSAPVCLSIEQRVGTIELTRPDKFNCLSSEAWTLIDGFRRDCEAGDVRAIVLRAQGDNFCTGADLDEVEALGSDAVALSAFIERDMLRCAHSRTVHCPWSLQYKACVWPVALN
jgi:enoyl-CoA hydratase